MNARSVRNAIYFRLPVGIALCAAFSYTASAQKAPLSDWHNIQALPSQTRIRVATDDGATHTCFLDSVSDDRVACFSSPSHEGSHYEFTRGQVKTIRLNGHSSAKAAAITAVAFTGAGAGIGAATDPGGAAKPILVGAAGGLGVGVVAGILVGRAFGGSHGSIVYQRP